MSYSACLNCPFDFNQPQAMPPIPINRTPANMKAYYLAMAQYCLNSAKRAWTDERQAECEREAAYFQTKANAL